MGTTGEPNGGTLTIDEDYNPFTLIVSKAGYETYYEKLTLTAEVNKVIALKTSVPHLIDDRGKIFRKINVVNQGNNRNFIIKL